MQVSQIPGGSKSKVGTVPVRGDGGGKLDALVPVSRPARWSFGLYRRGSSARV